MGWFEPNALRAPEEGRFKAEKTRVFSLFAPMVEVESERAAQWQRILKYVETHFGKKPDMNALLFLIGMRELGSPQTQFTKEQKVRLMDIALSRVLSPSGYFKLVGRDEKDWPVWERVKPLPALSIFEQETLLREHVIVYFEDEAILEE